MHLVFFTHRKTSGLPCLFGFCNADCPAVAADDAAIKAFATEAYIFGYPLVTMEVTHRVMTNVARPVNMRAPLGHFFMHRRILRLTFVT